MIIDILQLIAITFMPLLELRASIPYGILKLHMDWPLVFIVCVITNAIIGPLAYFFFDKVIHMFLKINIVDKAYKHYILRTQRKIHEPIEKYGWLGIAIFIGTPLPGTGVYSGMLAAYLLGTGYKKAFYAAIIGAVMAGIIVTAIVLSGAGAWSFVISLI